MNRLGRAAILSSALVLLTSGTGLAYNRSSAASYALTWCNTNYQNNPQGNVNHVNNPNAVFGGAGNYTWWYAERLSYQHPSLTSLNLTNDGNNTVPVWKGFDCTNFASQVLVAGGLSLTNLQSGQDDPSRGTFTRVKRLEQALKNSANVTLVSVPSQNSNPAGLDVGDLIELPYIGHFMVITATNPIRLSYHSTDRCGVPMSAIPFPQLYTFWLPFGWGVQGYHITGNIAALSDTTAPTMTMTNSAGATITSPGFSGNSLSVNITDASGISALSAYANAPVIDSVINAEFGLSNPIFYDGTSYATSGSYSLNLSQLSEGTTVYVIGYDGAGNSTMQTVQVDRTPPNQIAVTDTSGNPITYATSSTTVKIAGSDAFSGLYTINLTNGGSYNQTSTNTSPSPNVSYSDTFPLGGGTLADGSYTATVTDQAGNSASATFMVDTSAPGSGPRDPSGPTLQPITPSTTCVVAMGSAASGVAEISLTGPSGFSESQVFSCIPPSTSVELGTYCALAAGAYSETVTNCAQKTSSTTITIQTQSPTVAISAVTNTGSTVTASGATTNAHLAVSELIVDVCSNQSATCDGCTSDSMAQFYTGGGFACGSGFACCWQSTFPSPQSVDIPIMSTTTTSGTFSLQATAKIRSAGIDDEAGVTFTYNSLIGSHAHVEVSQFNPKFAISQGSASATSPFSATILSKVTCAGQTFLGQVLRLSIGGYTYTGSTIVFASTAPLSFSYQDPSADTTTLRIYRFNGVSWDSSSVTNQSVSLDTTTNVISLYGETTQGGEFAGLFLGHDSSAPITSLSFTASTSSFLSNVFVSTSAYAVLSATDPVVNGFASQVATTYYRLDATSAAASYSIYSSSLPLALGFHVLEFYSADYAGNIELVHTSTFLVTAGTLFTAGGSAEAIGNLLTGFLSYGNHVDVQSRAQNSYTLLVSSADRSPILATTNVGQTELGGWSPQAGLQSVPVNVNDPSLQLRSGNASTATASAQIALGYNGDVSMSHVIRSEHSSSAAGNAIDFLLWYPPTGSTTTLGNLEALALQELTATGGSFHVHPATGVATAQVEVSDGGTIGAGIVHRAAAYAVSSRALKSDIKYLSEKDQQRAYEDVMALKPATFRYRTDVPGTKRRGLILEETPESIHADNNRISYDERLVNVEMALKEASARLEKLRKRLKALEAAQ